MWVSYDPENQEIAIVIALDIEEIIKYLLQDSVHVVNLAMAWKRGSDADAPVGQSPQGLLPSPFGPAGLSWMAGEHLRL